MMEEINLERELSNLSPTEIAPHLYVATRDLNTLDGLWFLMVEEKYGTEVATAIDEMVWERFGTREAHRVRRAFGIEEGGLDGFLQVLRNSPSTAGFGTSRIERESRSRAVWQVLDCWPQAARVSKGLGTFNCRNVDVLFLESMAKAIDPRVKVTCSHCPPDERRDGVWCEWIFELRE